MENNEKKKIEPVINSGAKKKKQSLTKKFSQTFLAEDAASVKSYILFDVVLPAVKDLVADAGKSFIDALFYGEGKSGGRSRTGTNSRTSYTKYYDDRRVSYSRGSSNSNKEDRRERYSYEDVVFDSRGEAEKILETMLEYLDRYDFVTVSDFYQFCNLEDEHTDRNWGWDDLGAARTERVQGGYIIKFPRVKPA